MRPLTAFAASLAIGLVLLGGYLAVAQPEWARSPEARAQAARDSAAAAVARVAAVQQTRVDAANLAAWSGQAAVCRRGTVRWSPGGDARVLAVRVAPTPSYVAVHVTTRYRGIRGDLDGSAECRFPRAASPSAAPRADYVQTVGNGIAEDLAEQELPCFNRGELCVWSERRHRLYRERELTTAYLRDAITDGRGR